MAIRLMIESGEVSDPVLDSYMITAYGDSGEKLGTVGGTVYAACADCGDDAYEEVRVPYLILTDLRVEAAARKKGVAAAMIEAGLVRGAKTARASISDDILTNAGLAAIRSVVARHPATQWVETNETHGGYNSYRFRLTPWRVWSPPWGR